MKKYILNVKHIHAQSKMMSLRAKIILSLDNEAKISKTIYTREYFGGILSCYPNEYTT